MVACSVEIRNEALQKLRLPQDLTEGALALIRLRSCGVLSTASKRIQIDRQGGYSGVDALVYLILYFFGTPGRALRELWATIGPAAEKLGSLADRDRVVSSSTMSRLLAAAKPCLLYTSPSPRDGLLSRMPSSA